MVLEGGGVQEVPSITVKEASAPVERKRVKKE
jgi:hypothetical protein